MGKFKPGRDTPLSPFARYKPARMPSNCVRSKPSRNEMDIAYYLQYDNTPDHMPNTIPIAECVICQRPTVLHCVRCEAPLCVISNGDPNIVINCFASFHKPPKGKKIKQPSFLHN